MVRALGGSFVVVLLAGCPGDGVATGGSSESGGGSGDDSSGQLSASETGVTPTTSASAGSEAGTTVVDGSSSVTTGVEGSSSGGADGLCGPPCDAPWVHEGDLTIDAETDLASLRCLVEVTGQLEIGAGIDAPPAELANLRRVGWDLQIGWQHEMTSLAGLECVEFVGGTLQLLVNKELADISALAGVKHMGGLAIWGGLVTDLSLWDGVTGLTVIELKDVDVTRLPTPGPDTVLTELEIERCDALTDLDALAGVTGPAEGFSMTLRDLPKLTSVAGGAGLWQDGGLLWLEDLPLLESLAGTEGFAGDEFSSAILKQLPRVPDVEALAGIEAVDRLYLDGMPKVTTLAPLAGLRQVGTLTIGSCKGELGEGLDGLTSLAPLDGLEGVGILSIARNDALTTLPKLGALKFDISVIRLIDNAKLPAMQVEAFMAEHPEGCAAPPMACQCFEDVEMP